MKNVFYFLMLLGFLSCSKEISDYPPSTTINGSYTKIITVGNYIYGIQEETITTIDISTRDKPVIINKQSVGFTVENVFHHEGVLFIGSKEGLTIYTISAEGIPSLKSKTSYFEDQVITACDPVIASGDYAYITLKTKLSNGCGRFTNINELRIYDISDIEHPDLISITPLHRPSGLSLSGDYLFVCEQDSSGLSIINVSDKVSPTIMQSFYGFESYDVIATNGLLMVVCSDEIRQYDYTDINNVFLLSTIEL